MVHKYIYMWNFIQGCDIILQINPDKEKIKSIFLSQNSFRSTTFSFLQLFHPFFLNASITSYLELHAYSMNRILAENLHHYTSVKSSGSCLGPHLEKLCTQWLFAHIVKWCVGGPSRPESGPVDDIRGQFRNCVSVEFAVGANDRKTRSADTPRGARATGALSWRNNCGLRSRSAGII